MNRREEKELQSDDLGNLVGVGSSTHLARSLGDSSMIRGQRQE